MKTESETKHVWDRVNTQRPIWLRSPKECTDSEYAEFYKSTFRGYDDPLGYTHFSLEGQVEFKSVLYVPSALPFELSRNMFDEDSRAMKLYVKRVFISDKFEELLPRWLMFVRGVVDSEDLPLNVSREILQKSKILTIISKRLVRKAIDMFKAIKEDEAKFETFTKNYGKYVKVGVIEDLLQQGRDRAPDEILHLQVGQAGAHAGPVPGGHAGGPEGHLLRHRRLAGDCGDVPRAGALPPAGVRGHLRLRAHRRAGPAEPEQVRRAGAAGHREGGRGPGGRGRGGEGQDRGGREGLRGHHGVAGQAVREEGEEREAEHQADGVAGRAHAGRLRDEPQHAAVHEGPGRGAGHGFAPCSAWARTRPCSS
ncbi:unnamed protein product [Heterosigma akashiwo]